MSGIDPQRTTGGSRVAGYVIATALGAPFLFLAVAYLLQPPGLAVAAGLTVAIVGFTFALRAWSEDREHRPTD